MINIECDGNGEVVVDPYCATGSGAKTALALMRRLRQPSWKLRAALVVAFRTISDAILVEPSGIGEPIQLVKYYRSGDECIIENVDPTGMKEIRHTAGLWGQLELEALQSAFAGKPKAVASDIPRPRITSSQ